MVKNPKESKPIKPSNVPSDIPKSKIELKGYATLFEENADEVKKFNVKQKQ
jgi:hypothetical protein